MIQKLVFTLVLGITSLLATNLEVQINECKSGNVQSCYTAATALTTGKNAENQEKKTLGLDLMRKACKFGEEKAKRMTGFLLKNYKRLALIDTGQYEIERYRDYTRSKAEEFELRFEEIDGSSRLIEKMLRGPWDEEFAVVELGNSVTYEDFTKQKSNPEE